MTAPAPTPPSSDADRRRLDHRRKAHNRLAARLIISIPALFSLVVIAYGVAVLNIVFYYARADDWYHVAFWILFALLGFSLLAAAIGVGLAYSILSPLRAIAQALERVAQGALEETVQVVAGQEIEAIGESFNSMVQQLNKVFQERNRYLVDTSRVGLLTVDPETRLATLNTAGEQILGLRANDILGKRLGDLPPSLLTDSGCAPFFQRIGEAVVSDEHSFHSDLIALRGEAGERRLSVTLSLDRQSEGLPKGYVFTFRDVTQGEAMRRRLARTDQLAAMGAFAMGLAHELRNPLGSIKGMAQLLEETAVIDEAASNFASRIADEVDRLDSFIRELLEFGQEAPESPAPSDLGELAAEALHLARSGAAELVDKGLRVETKFAAAPPIALQRHRVVRALANLISNAFDAAPPGAVVRVATCIEGAAPLERSVVEVENEGPPIPEEDLPRIFEPFYTTKPKGTGLGLAIAYQIAVQNGGDLAVRRADGRTRFALSFPLPLDLARAIKL
ncbi:MAG: ATP-binding protein [Candidatus Sumerlaeota bacterium]|nr:ATP-binding protein [Candidatus Sumerlaeota bacterium]